MTKEIKDKIIAVCDEKIAKKGSNVGLSFMLFLKTKTLTQKH